MPVLRLKNWRKIGENPPEGEVAGAAPGGGNESGGNPRYRNPLFYHTVVLYFRTVLFHTLTDGTFSNFFKRYFFKPAFLPPSSTVLPNGRYVLFHTFSCCGTVLVVLYFRTENWIPRGQVTMVVTVRFLPSHKKNGSCWTAEYFQNSFDLCTLLGTLRLGTGNA